MYTQKFLQKQSLELSKRKLFVSTVTYIIYTIIKLKGAQ